MRFYLFILFLFLVNLSYNQEVEFYAEASKSKIGLDERLRIEFKMNVDGDNFIEPSFEGFIPSGKSQSTGSKFVNGKRSFSRTYTFILSPTKKGNFSIGQATIEYDGKIYKTSPLEVQVIEANQSSSSSENSNSLVNDDINLILEISKDNPYLNEVITLEYNLLLNPNIRISTAPNQIDIPKFKNFWSQDLENNLDLKYKTYKGQRYQYLNWKKYILFPQKTGELEILPMTLDVIVDVPTNKRDFFGRTYYETTSKRVSTGKRIIKVKPLPEKNKPESFNGAVGSFDISIKPSKFQLNATESLQLEFKINGNGNLKLFTLPNVTTPSSIEKYSPEYKEKINTNTGGMSGEISNTYTLVPKFKGKYPIPAVEFSYFNPSAGNYITKRSNEIIIDVSGGPINPSNSSMKPNFENNKIISTADQFDPIIKSNSNFYLINKKSFVDTKKILYTILLFPVVLVILVFIYFKLNKKTILESSIKSRRADSLARKYLKNAKIDINNEESFYSSLENAMFNFIKSKYLIEKKDFSKENLSKILSEHNVSNEIILDINEILNNCELARFTPINTDEMDNDYEKAVKIISNFDNK